ncbi:MAG: hypothetical protein K2X66_15870 [Cyanobacteria bacterium]|nr:hypothetical protein [Cyanobacteriota bacterium]
MVSFLPPAFADQVYLKSNSPQSPILYEGKVLSMSGQEILIQLQDGRKAHFKREEVHSIQLDTPGGELKSVTVPLPVPSESYQPPLFEKMEGFPVPPPLPNALNSPPTMLDTHSSDSQSGLSQPSLRGLVPPPSASYNNLPNAQQPMTQLMFSPLLPIVSFPSAKGEVNETQFVTLSKFKGSQSKITYAGLYNFINKGTFWIRLPQPQLSKAELQFMLYGKQTIQENKILPPETFSVQALFLDENGVILEQSSVATFQENQPELIEWFQLLEGMSGLSGKMQVTWHVPHKTKNIEFRVIAAAGEGRHLVGYLSQLSLAQFP